MKRLLPLLIAALLTPVAASAHQCKEEMLLAHESYVKHRADHRVVFLMYEVCGEPWITTASTFEECERRGQRQIGRPEIRCKNGDYYKCFLGPEVDKLSTDHE